MRLPGIVQVDEECSVVHTGWESDEQAVTWAAQNLPSGTWHFAAVVLTPPPATRKD